MSLIKNIEIDTLRLRNLQVRDAKNNPVSSGFQLYALGDGTTSWSPGVNAQQFIYLSSSVNNLNSTINYFGSTVVSTVEIVISTVAANIYSTIYTLSSLVTLLQTYEINTAYTDAKVALYSTQVAANNLTIFQTIVSSQILYTQTNQNIANIATQLFTEIYNVSTAVSSTNGRISKTSTIVTSTLFGGLSTFVTSTFIGYSSIQGANFVTLEKLIEANIAFTESTFTNITSSQNKFVVSLSSISLSQTAALNALSTQVIIGLSTVYQSSIIYTNSAISTLYMSTTTLVQNSRSTLQSEIATAVSSLLISRSTIVQTILTQVQTVSTQNASSFTYLQNSIALLLSTGLTQSIYTTFIDLQGYSASTIFATQSTTTFIVYSTSTDMVAQGLTLYNDALQSSYIWATTSLYDSTFSTVFLATNSTINALLTSSLNYFDTIIVSTYNQYDTQIINTIANYEQDLTNLTILYEQQIENQINVGLSSQNAIYTESISSISSLIENALSTNVIQLSSFTYSQFVTAPTQIINKTDNISTLTNVFADTGLSSINVGIINIDATTYNNFHVQLSDIGTNVFYGLTVSTSLEKINQDFTIQVDIRSTYSNSFLTLDTTNFSAWLTTPTIYNPNSFSFQPINVLQNPVPKADTTQQIYISSFIGAYIINMKYTNMGLFIRDIQTYPFIYSNVTFTGNLSFPRNVQTLDSNLALVSTFVYRGTPIAISWQTNDLNIPLGVKFTGRDLYGNYIANWTGPYSSGKGSAMVKVPTPNAPLAVYDAMHLCVYPNTANGTNTAAGNANSNTFSTRQIPSSLYVVNPTANTYVRVLNPGLTKFLQVADIKVNNDNRQNLLSSATAVTNFTIDTVDINVNVFPFNGSYSAFGSQNAFDGNPSTYYYGGYITGEPNINAYVGGKFKTVAPFSQMSHGAAQISSIEISQGPLFNLQGMQLIVSNYNEPGIQDGLFYSTITLNSDARQTYIFG